MARTLNARERALIRATIIVIVVTVLLRLVWVPLRDWRAARTERVRVQETALAELETNLETARRLRETVRNQKEKTGHPEARFADPEERHTVMAYLDKLGKQHGLKIEKFDATSVDKSADPPNFEVLLEGKGQYASVVKFFHHLQYADYVMRPVDLILKGDRELEVRLRLRVYTEPGTETDRSARMSRNGATKAYPLKEGARG